MKLKISLIYVLSKLEVLIPLIFAIGIWYLIRYLNIISIVLWPPFEDVVKTLFEMFTTFTVMGTSLKEHLIRTFLELAITFILVISMGFGIGLLIGVISFLRDVFEPLIYIIWSSPGIVLFPIFFLIFGIGIYSKIAYGLFLGLFPMLINVLAGIRQLDRSWIRIGKALGANSWQLLTKVIIPGILPNVFIGIRLGVGSGLIGVFVAQTLASDCGIGYLISVATFTFDMKTAYALVFFTLILCFIINYVIVKIEEKALAYRLVGGE